MANEKNLKPWKPGQSGNPKGRPKGRTMTARLRDAVEEAAKDGRDKGDAIAAKLVEIATGADPKANGAAVVKAIATIFERLDGKAVQPLQIAGTEDAAPLRLAAFEAAVARVYPIQPSAPDSKPRRKPPPKKKPKPRAKPKPNSKPEPKPKPAIQPTPPPDPEPPPKPKRRSR